MIKIPEKLLTVENLNNKTKSRKIMNGKGLYNMMYNDCHRVDSISVTIGPPPYDFGDNHDPISFWRKSGPLPPKNFF